MLSFRDLPIRQKLTWANVATSSVALLLASIGFVAYEWLTFRDTMVQQLSTQAGIIGYNAASAVVFDDRVAATRTLAALQAEKHILSAAIYKRDGQLFADYVRHDSSTPMAPLPAGGGYEFQGDRLLAYDDIVVDGEVVGRVQLASDLTEMTTRLNGYMIIVAGVFFVSVVAAFPVLSWLQRVISGPIMHLVDKARIVSEQKNYSVRAMVSSHDELGLLTRTFNEMLSQIEERDAELQGARVEAERANRAKDEFLAVASHELRTPLTPVLGWIHMLRAGTLDAKATKQAIEIIERNVKSQAQLIEDLLDVSRIITGKLRLDAHRIDLTPIVEQAVDSVRPTAEVKGVHLQAALETNVGVILGDPERLKQIMWNLLSNATKFTPKGGHVRVALARASSQVTITVSDSGIGIAPEFIPYVFDRFRQSDSTSTRAYGGLGLGLAIVRHLVELHGGRVYAESPGLGLGATFRVELPIAAAMVTPPAERPQPTAVQVPERGVRLDGLRVLAVDDEADTGETVRALLAQAGAVVRVSKSAGEALRVMQSWRPDVLISDIGMPEEDGFDLIRQVRGLPDDDGGRTPALALTAYARVEDRVRVLAAGFQMHVPKPIEPTELVAVVASLAEWTTKTESSAEA